MSRKTAEQEAIANSDDGLSDHEMTSGWRVIVARLGAKCATWYYHQNDDGRHKAALWAEAERRLNMWRAGA